MRYRRKADGILRVTDAWLASAGARCHSRQRRRPFSLDCGRRRRALGRDDETGHGPRRANGKVLGFVLDSLARACRCPAARLRCLAHVFESPTKLRRRARFPCRGAKRSACAGRDCGITLKIRRSCSPLVPLRGGLRPVRRPDVARARAPR